MRIPRRGGVSQVGSGAQVQSSMTGLATDTFGAAMDLVGRYKEQQDSSDIQDAQNKKVKELNDWKAANYSRQGESALGMTKEYMEKTKEIDERVSSNLSPKAKRLYGGWSQAQDNQDRLNVMLHEQKQDMAVKESRFNTGLTVAEDMIRQDARTYREAALHVENTLQNGLRSGIIKPEEYDAKKTEIENRFRSELGKSYYTQDKHEFMKNINGFGFGKPEISKWQEKYKDDLRAEERERKTLYAEEARMIMDQRKDFSAQAIDKGDTSHYFSGAQKLRSMGYKDWARDLESEGKLYDRTIKFNDQYKGAPLSEKLKAAQDLTVSDQVEGSGLDFEARKTIQKETYKQVQIFNKDPAGFVSNRAQGNTPEEIASSRISLQRNQGIIPEKGFNVLTFQEKTGYKQAFEAGDERQKAELVQELTKYGKHAPKVIQELEVNKALAFAPMLQDKKALELLVSAASSRPTNLDPNVKEADYKAAAQDSKIYQVMAKVQRDFPTDSGLGEQIKDMQTAMVNIGLKKMDVGAGAKFFDDNFEVEEDSDKTIYFPKSFDSDDVIKTLDEKKQQISDSISLDNKEMATRAKWAVRDYTWVNSPNGFVLADKKSGRVVPGSYVEFEEVRHGLKNNKKSKGE
nr:hypothetical protein BHI3_07670 [Bacteriovorax sp. HI3]